MAYVRFASVYRQFADVESFFNELKKLMGDRKDAQLSLIHISVHTVTDEAVDAELKRVQERNARELTREGAAQNGDIVDIDFEGFVRCV